MTKRTWIALIVAPLWLPICVVGTIVLMASSDPILSTMSRTEAVTLSLAVSAPAAYLIMLIVGVPIGLALNARKLRRVTPYIVSGFCSGVMLRCIGIAIVWFSFAYRNKLESSIVGRELSDAFLHEPMRLLAPGLIGLLVGATYWLIARPDLHPPISE
ncbi:hypothetical protein FS827_14775 [Agrobacterium vitis]|uniref:hypothetical protein n=1 Tax=Allorhizobium ampelinum TaxID=3025782 RepID=UPI001F46D079|nr:hypothetical protein [Allorhizobium ampelinum]MCF1462574.1 hypothetical protein [Allorhizobium ampelinum]